MSGQPARYESQVPYRDGGARWIEAEYILHFGDRREVRGFFALVHDITERKRVEGQIARQAAVLQAINEVFRETLACETEEELGKTCLAVAEKLTGSKFGFLGELNAAGLMDDTAISNPGWDACEMAVSDARKYTTNMPIRGIYGWTIREGKSQIVNGDELATHPDRVGTPEGHPPITAFLGVPLKHEGKVIGMIGLGNKESGYDTADQEGVENLAVAIVEALRSKRAEEALRESDDRYRSFVQNFWGIAFRGRMDFTPIFSHGAVEEITGYTEREFLDGKPRWDQVIHPEDLPALFTEDEERLHSIPHYSYDREYRIVRKDAAVRWVHEVIQNVCDDSGKLAMVQGAIYDITERKRAEEERERLEEQFRHSQKMEAVGELAGGVAHEFNNMLAAILGHAEILEGGLSEDGSAHADNVHALQQIMKAGQRAGELTHQLLAFGRKQIVKPARVNLNRIVSDSVNMLRRLTGERIRLQTDMQLEVRSVLADAGQMEQVLINLALNARDAMPEGGELTIETANVEVDEEWVASHVEAKTGPHVRLRVKDGGHGMDEETRRRIFEPFFTTKPVGKGSGLGLSVVDGIVAQAGGHVTVESEPDRGTTVGVLLPAAGASEALREPAERVAVVPAGRKTILVCEDEEMVLDSLSQLLEGLGFTVLRAGSGPEALQKAETYPGRIDLLVADVVMPGMSGPALARMLIEQDPDLGVLYMTGYGPEVLEPDSGLGDWARLILKPHRTDELLGTLNELLTRQQE